MLEKWNIPLSLQVVSDFSLAVQRATAGGSPDLAAEDREVLQEVRQPTACITLLIVDTQALSLALHASPIRCSCAVLTCVLSTSFILSWGVARMLRSSAVLLGHFGQGEGCSALVETWQSLKAFSALPIGSLGQPTTSPAPPHENASSNPHKWDHTAPYWKK